MKIRTLRLTLSLLVLASMAPLVAERAVAEPADHVVQVGALNPENGVSTYNYQRFYPDRLRVHRGDTVSWQWAAAGYFGWHSVSFVPGDMDVAAHPDGLDSALPPIIRRDELGYALAERWVFGHDGSPSGSSPCGRSAWRNLPAQGDCVLNRTDAPLGSSVSDTFFNKPGAPQNISWTAKIDLAEGAYRYRCLVHPAMVGVVDVVPPGEALPAASQIALETAQQIQTDTDAADAVFQQKNDVSNAYDPETGTWTVNVGAETPDRHVAIYSFMPANLPIEAGESVVFRSLIDEPNTVTFPPHGAGTFGPPHQGCTPNRCGQGSSDPSSQLPGYGLGFLAFPFVCDPDDPGTGAPGAPLYAVRATWACTVGNLEWLVSPYMSGAQAAPGNDVATPATFHNSGALIAATAPAWYAGPFAQPAPYAEIPRIASTFDATFPNAGTFQYVCLAHPDFMTGRITAT